MKRHEAIAPLSRDHHGSLILARLLKKNAPVYRGLPQDTAGKIKYAQQHFEEDIKKHFHQEERLLQMVKGTHEEIDRLAEEIMNEHLQIKFLFGSLSSTGDAENKMDILADTLEAHIRKEERVLFPLLQEYCSEQQLQKLHDLLH